MAWIDYKKAFDSVPHSSILKPLRMYRFNEKVIRFMETSMNKWNTTMKLFYNDGCIITEPIKIKRGIFQGDSFSTLLFCLAATGYGYKIASMSAPVSNLVFMGDIKLYGKNDQEQFGQLKIVKQFSDDIDMTFKLVSTGNIEINDAAIQELNQEEAYKYLGVDESDGIQHSKMKEKIREEYNRRVRLILRTELNGRNKMEAITGLALPVVCSVVLRLLTGKSPN